MSGCTTLKGEPCRIPFNYKGVRYKVCTTVANNGVPWCYTANGYGTCADSCKYETGKIFETRSQDWKYMHTIVSWLIMKYSGCLTTTGESCRFPFTYRGVEYTECTPVANNGIPWCYTSSGFGNCVASCSSDSIASPGNHFL